MCLITIEKLEARKRNLAGQMRHFQDSIVNFQSEIEKATNDLNAISGAIQDCDFWIKELTVVEQKGPDLSGTVGETFDNVTTKDGV
jgi:predicted  nucleic acid-binding Zn-ribbon protein